MRLLALALCVLPALPVLAQKKTTCKVKYRSNALYRADLETTALIEIEFKGDEALLDQLRAGGVSFPMVSESAQEMTALTYIGTPDAHGDLPMTMKYDKYSARQTVNGREIERGNPLAGLLIEGRIMAGGETRIDSIYGGLYPMPRENMEQLIRTVQNNVTFPAGPIKVGEQFTQDTPMSIPLTGMKGINIVIKTTYTLREISHGEAHFDLLQDITLDSTISQADAEGNTRATGRGTGQMTFNIKQGFVSRYLSNVDMDLMLKVVELEILAKNKTKTELAVQIE